MISHVSVGTNDLEKARDFYDKVLATIGYRRLYDFEGCAAYGDKFPGFWLAKPLDESKPASAGNGVHIAFHAESRAKVQAFYDAALAAGGTSDGAPGPRPLYGDEYYGCFVYDLDGHKIEAECYGAKE